MPSTPTYFEPQITLDRNSPVPLYHQIAAPIEKLILSGELAPGTRLEDELSMAKRLRISRPTARRALQTLGDHGLLVRRRGVGTLVAPNRVHRPSQLSSLWNEIRDWGSIPTTEVLSYALLPATTDMARHLEINPGEEIVEIKRLRFSDGKPIAVMYNLIKAESAPSTSELVQSGFYAALAKRGINPAMVKQAVGARKATPVESRLLEEAPHAAVLTMTRTAYDTAGNTIDYGEHVFRGATYTLQNTIFAR